LDAAVFTLRDKMEKLNLNLKKMDHKLKSFFKNYDLNLCFTCGTCASGCPISGTPGLDNMNSMKMLRLLALGLVEEAAASDFSWLCTGCGRCSYGCPMNIDIPSIMETVKKLRSRDRVPGVTDSGPGRETSVLDGDCAGFLGDLGEELSEAECPWFSHGYDRSIRLLDKADQIRQY
jgi:dimethylglycine catabolism B